MFNKLFHTFLSVIIENKADRQTHRNTYRHTHTDKKVKTEGPKILSNDVFYFKTVIIGGPIVLFILVLDFSEIILKK